MTADIRIVDAGGPHEKVTVEFMRRQGCFEGMGITAHKTYVTNGAAAVEKLLSGDCDVAMQVGFGPAVVAISKGAPLRVIAASNLLTVHAVYSREPDIRCLADLEGKTVGVGRLGALTHQLLYAALLKSHVDPARVHFASIGSSATVFQALLAGEVDAGFGETEVFEHQDQYGVHALEDGVLWERLPEFPNQASFATENALHDNRDVLVRTLAAHALLYRALHHPDSWAAYREAWTAALPQSTLDEGRTQWQFYQRYHPFAEDLLLSQARFDYMQDLNITMQLQERALSYAEAADMSLAHDALRLLDDQSKSTSE